MKIDISDETVNNLMVDVMIRDYKYLKADIERFQQKPILSDIEQEDLDNWNKHLEGLALTLDYYAGRGWEQYVGL